jgi:hypothetical protein
MYELFSLLAVVVLVIAALIVAIDTLWLIAEEVSNLFR